MKILDLVLLEKIKKKKLNESRFNMRILYIIVNILFFCIAFTFASIIIVNKYKREYYYLANIIDFQSDNFTKYLNYLGELKKQLKKDSNEKEDNSENENFSKNEDLKKNKIMLDKSKSKDNRIKDTESINKKYQNKNINKKKLKINKISFQKQEKKKIMSKYFLKQNIYSAYRICSVFIFSMFYYLLIRFLYSFKKNKYISYDDIEGEIISSSLNTFLDYALIKFSITQFAIYISNYISCYNQLKNNSLNLCKLNNIEYSFNNISESKYTFPNYDNLLLYENEDNNLILKLINDKNIDSNSIQGKIVKIYSSDMCESLSEFITINYTHCSKFWDSILLQGSRQATIYGENLLKKLIQGFENFNNDQNYISLMNKLDDFYFMELYVVNYLFPSTKYEIVLFALFKKEKLKSMFKMFNDIVYLSAFEIIFLFFILMFSIYQMKKTNSLMNFAIIFPLKYIHEKSDFYNDVINLNTKYF